MILVSYNMYDIFILYCILNCLYVDI